MKNPLSRLNGWQRLGFVASIIWFFVATLATEISQVRSADAQADLLTSACRSNLDHIPQGPDWAKQFELMEDHCVKMWVDTDTYWITNSWPMSFATGLIPIPLGWLFVYGLLGLVRWIVRGGFPKFRSSRANE